MPEQPAEATMKDQDGSDRVRGEIDEVLRAFYSAVERRDLGGFLALFTGDAGLTVVENADRFDWPAFQAYAEQFFREVRQVAFEPEPAAINLLAADVAVATGAFRGRGVTVGGEQIDVHHAYTFVLARRDHGWRIAHVHESALPAT